MSKKTQLVKLTPNEVKDFLRHIVTTNVELQKEGKNPVSIEVKGESGLGKTSSVIQLSKELDIDFVKLNLAQIEEIGDLVGFPVKQYQMKNGDETNWVDEPLLADFTSKGYEPTGLNRMSYSAPEWIVGKEKGGILLLDDWNRAEPRFIQACMELIDRQEYISWRLPKGWTIVLTANPEDKDYNVSAIDNAQKTRFISIELKFDIDCWAKWAESAKIDSRCINFLMLSPELIKGDVNARSVAMFFNSISSFESFEANLPMIQMIGEGSVGGEFASMFTTFIHNKLDKLPTPVKIFDENQENDQILRALKASIKSDQEFRADIASTLSTRMINYLEVKAREVSFMPDYIIERILFLVKSKVFKNDITFNMVKEIYNINDEMFSGLLMDIDVANYLMD